MKLVPDVRPLHVPNEYNKTDFTFIFRAITRQVNDLSEGKIRADYNAQSTVPSGAAVAYATGDIVRDSNPTVQASIAPGLSASYVRLGWIYCDGELKEMRAFTGI